MAIVRFKRGDVMPSMAPEMLAYLDAMTPKEIERNALEDPDNPPLTDEELELGHVSRNIRLMREGLDLSQEEFAARYGFDINQLLDWENGRLLPDHAMRANLRLIQRDPAAGAALVPAE